MSKFHTLNKISLIRSIYNNINPVTGVILMLHRVTNDRSELKDNRILEITPSFLEETILHFQDLQYEFVSIDTAYQIQKGEYKTERPYVCFTFDDGFEDNYSNAFPVFTKYHTPFTIYITTDFVDNKRSFWWYQLDYLLQHKSSIKLPDKLLLSCKRSEEKNQAFRLLNKKIKNTAKGNELEYLLQLFQINDLDPKTAESVAPLTWDEIKIMHDTGLCSIGSHGVTHRRLDLLNNDDLTYELLHSREKLEARIGDSVKHLAYPFGNFSSRIARITQQCGYLSAVRVDGGMQRQQQSPFPFKRSILIQ